MCMMYVHVHTQLCICLCNMYIYIMCIYLHNLYTYIYIHNVHTCIYIYIHIMWGYITNNMVCCFWQKKKGFQMMFQIIRRVSTFNASDVLLDKGWPTAEVGIFILEAKKRRQRTARKSWSFSFFSFPLFSKIGMQSVWSVQFWRLVPVDCRDITRTRWDFMGMAAWSTNVDTWVHHSLPQDELPPKPVAHFRKQMIKLMAFHVLIWAHAQDRGLQSGWIPNSHSR